MQANIYLSINEKIKLTPHMLRHIFLKRIADKYVLHVTQDLSGNVTIKEIFRYIKLDHNQKHDMAQELF
jgi:integrase/recombinase XerD